MTFGHVEPVFPQSEGHGLSRRCRSGRAVAQQPAPLVVVEGSAQVDGAGEGPPARGLDRPLPSGLGLPPGALAGGYGGVSASVAAGLGLGANVLVGGSAKQITLQPVSVEGSVGLNVAAGIGEVILSAGK